jgi:integrase
MAENKLTDKFLRSLKPTSKEQVLGDGGGLWLRVLPTEKGGALNFYYRFEFSGKERRFNCGSYPSTTLAKAREARNEARRLAKSGVDPTLQYELDREARSAAQAMESMEKTVSELFDDWKRVYLSVHRRDGGTSVEAAMKIDVLKHIGTMRARDVRLPHVVTVVDRIVERGVRRTANIALSHMRQMFRHGLARGIVETDPTLGMTKKQAGGTETPSDRNLTLDEIKALAIKMPDSGLHKRMQAAIWLILATGVRIGELLKARWVDLDLNQNTWTIPAENSKNGRPHLVHLSAFALKQINILKGSKYGPYLLAGRSSRKDDDPDGINALGLTDKALSKAIRDRTRTEPLKKRTPNVGSLILPGGEWSAHDLRRTMATRMGDLGVAPHIIERCLNHIQQGIVGVYQRQEYLGERQSAYETWGAQLDSLTRSETVQS